MVSKLNGWRAKIDPRTPTNQKKLVSLTSHVNALLTNQPENPGCSSPGGAESPLVVCPHIHQAPDHRQTEEDRGYVSCCTFGTGICLWSSNRQKKNKKQNYVYSHKKVKKNKEKKASYFFSSTSVRQGAGGVSWNGDERNREALMCLMQTI